MVDFEGVAEIWTDCSDAPDHTALTAILTPAWDKQVLVMVVVMGLEELESLEASLAPLGGALRAHPDFYGLPSVVIKADILNLRSGPGTGNEKLGELALGDVAFVFGKDGATCGWYYVWAGNQYGWISADPEYAALDWRCADLKVVTPAMILEWSDWVAGKGW
jgi:hypothetical protein